MNQKIEFVESNGLVDEKFQVFIYTSPDTFFQKASPHLEHFQPKE